MQGITSIYTCVYVCVYFCICIFLMIDQYKVIFTASRFYYSLFIDFIELRYLSVFTICFYFNIFMNVLGFVYILLWCIIISCIFLLLVFYWILTLQDQYLSIKLAFCFNILLHFLIMNCILLWTFFYCILMIDSYLSFKFT